MPRTFLSESQRKKLERFPESVIPEDIVAYFTLSESDLSQIPVHSSTLNRLGFAIQLCTLRMLGFCPVELIPPQTVIAYVAGQLNVPPQSLETYGQREQTRTDHFQKVLRHLGFRRTDSETLDRLLSWLVQRALEHNRPSLLLQMACEKLYQEKYVRPGLTVLERIVSSARTQAQRETFTRLLPLLSDSCKSSLDQLLQRSETLQHVPLSWLRKCALTNSPKSILATLEKLKMLDEWGVVGRSLDALNPNRIKFLASIGRRASIQALQQMREERRYPILLAFLHESLLDVMDELLDLYERCLVEISSRARRDQEKDRWANSSSTAEKLVMLRQIFRTILNQDIGGQELRASIHQEIPVEVMRATLEEIDGLLPPLSRDYFFYLGSRFNYTRQFSPTLFEHVIFYSTPPNSPLLQAIGCIRTMNRESRRKVPEDVPLDFVSKSWKEVVLKPNQSIDRHYYELCVLWELRNALRSGGIWVKNSRRYASLDAYLMPQKEWNSVRVEVCQQLQLPESAAVRLQKRSQEFEQLVQRVENAFEKHDNVRIEAGKVIISPLKAEEKAGPLSEFEQQIVQRLPRIELTDLLLEVDRWTRFSQHFEHAAGSESQQPNQLTHLYASLLSQGCNMALTRMAQCTGLQHEKLVWYTNWYLREDTLRAANTTLVNFQHHQPLSQYWGTGTLSSSDGQRFPVSGKVRNATALPKYFGYGKGLTFYTWTSDQYSQYGTKVVSSTMRDATYVLDEILDNETELAILEHTTDTDGYTEMVFALFDLLGIQFAPRLRDVGGQRIYVPTKEFELPETLIPLFSGSINQKMISEYWGEMARIVGSLKSGWATASLLMSKLRSYPQKSRLCRAFEEYGRYCKTLFILRYIESEAYRRKINRQLNKGEALHFLRRFLFFANQGKIRRKQEEQQLNQATCLNLLTNAVIVWNTVYMNAVLKQLAEEGMQFSEVELARISPCRFQHINPFGKFEFTFDSELSLEQLRPLRKPKGLSKTW